MKSVPAFLALSLVIFLGYKLTFWANAVILLSLMNRKIDDGFWKFSFLEFFITSIAAMSVAHAIIFNHSRIFIPMLFMISTFVYIFYMSFRVWRLSEHRSDT